MSWQLAWVAVQVRLQLGVRATFWAAGLTASLLVCQLYKLPDVICRLELRLLSTQVLACRRHHRSPHRPFGRRC